MRAPRTCRAMLVGMILAAAPRVHAQAVPAAPVAAAPMAAPDDAWLAYDEAFDALVEGRRDDARRIIDGLAARRANHPAVERARSLLRLWPARQVADGTLLPFVPLEAPSQEEEEDSAAGERPSQLSRAVLATGATLFGIAGGLEVCVATQCNSAGAAFGLPLLMGGSALGITLAATTEGIRPGTGALLESGFAWGTWNAFALGVIENPSGQRFAGGLLVGQGLGLATGGILSRTVQPTAGQVSLSSTVGMWTGLLTWFSRGARNLPTANDVSMATMLTTSDIGLVAGALLSAGYPVSRSHAALIDAGGIGGALLGMGSVAIIGGKGTHWATYYKVMLPSTLLGLAAAGYFTRDWEGPSLPVSVAITPAPGGATALVGGTF